MLRLFLILDLVAAFLSITSALGTETLGNSLENRIAHSHRHVGPIHHKHRKGRKYNHRPTKPKPYNPSPPSCTPCPIGKPYYIQASANNNYGFADSSNALGGDSFDIVFNATHTTTATIFSFARSDHGVCRLTLFRTAAHPSVAGFYSYVYDINATVFGSDHYVFITGPVGPEGSFVPRELECKMRDNSLLMCSVDDPTGGPPQNVLQLDKSDEGQLVINTLTDMVASTFTLIPAGDV